MRSFPLYEGVRIKGTSVTGVIVAVDTDGNTKPSIYFVEKDEIFKSGDPNADRVWCAPYALALI